MNNTIEQNDFTFEISLSVLNHLGRNLYRSFATVLGEAISNAWDAEAENVYIYIDKKKNNFYIKDDGMGMTKVDFQNKFLKIGYSKRRESSRSPNKHRPYIGRKGIGKLALLSCADKITIISKVNNGEYIGGVINNTDLGKAITDDITPKEYPLGKFKIGDFSKYTNNHGHGTIIYFENINEGIKHSLDLLKKIIALYFRFSLLDNMFNIYMGDEKVTQDCLNDLADNTEFLWEINDIKDPYIAILKEKFTDEKNEKRKINIKKSINGFIASVEKPRDLKIITTDEKIGVDLFVNGRLRERDIIKHIPTARVVESYLYGQIHVNDMDDKVDRFTSSREGIVADDPKYKKFLDILRKKVINIILDDWDAWRIKHRKDGDPDNTNMAKRDRRAGELYNAVVEEYSLPKGSGKRKKVDGWVNDLQEDAKYNFGSYAECFISENLIRKYIKENKIPLTAEAIKAISELQKIEKNNKNKGNVSIDIRKNNTDLSYLSMDGLANLVDKRDPIKEACLSRDANEYKPIRDALAHTALLTDAAKRKLTTVYENIKGRIIALISN